jgi:hypothetical protein
VVVGVVGSDAAADLGGVRDHGGDDDGAPTDAIVYLPYAVLSLQKRAGRWSVVDRLPNPLGVVLVEPLTYDPQLDRPFGRSRITRAVMDITDRAARTVMRTEISAEFYASPQRYVLGADESAWADVDKWKAVMGRFLTLTKDEDGDTPQVGQFPQATMQPHFDMLRLLATQFAGETGVPVSSSVSLRTIPPRRRRSTRRRRT